MTITSPSPTRNAIAAGNRRFMDAFARGDAAAVAALYTVNGSVLPPGAEPVEGPVAIQRFWESVFGLGITGAALESGEIEVADNFAYEVGRYTMTTADGAVADAGKYIVIWKLDGDRWMLHRDIWNTSRSAG